MKKYLNNKRKYPFGGTANTPQELNTQNNLTQSNPQIDQATSAVPVYGQIYGLAKGGSSLGKSLIQKDSNGNPINPEGRVANDWLTPDHELIINGFKQDGAVGGVREALGIGKIGRTISTLAGHDNAGANSKWGQFNQQVGMKYPNGGVNMAPNAEVEKEENTLNPDGSTDQYDGPSHEEGGIPTQLDPNTLIFSDKLKMPGTKKTFADLNKVNNTDKESKTLEDNKTSRLKRLTANLMKDAKIKQSLSLFEEQENLKANKLDNYAKRLGINDNSNEESNEYSNGGRINIKPSHKGRFTAYLKRTGSTLQQALHSNSPHVRQMANFARNAKHWKHSNGGIQRYPGGGITEDDTYGMEAPNYTSQNGTNYYGSDNNSGINTNDLAMETPNQGMYAFENANRGGTNNTTSLSNEFQPTSNGLGNKPSRNNSGMWGTLALQGASLIAQNAGNIYDLKRANNVTNEVYNRVDPTYLDPTAELKYNDLQARKATQDIKNASIGNASTYINARTGINNAAQLNNSRTALEYKNYNAQIANQSKYYNAGVGDKQTIANLMNQAQARNLRGNAIRGIGSSVGQTATGVYGDTKMEQRDKDVLGIIAARYPEAMNDPGLMEYFKKNR